jgi:predicted unusual protein kinase regulating ubiquinone biosynthesis (AarF/ABC1/UbiB family)
MFVHIDLHPENIIFDCEFDSKGDHKLKVSFIDAGIVTKLGGGDFTNLLNVSVAVMLNDAEKFSRLIVEGSPDKYCASLVGFKKANEKILDQLFSGKDFNDIDFVDLAKDFLKACARFDVKLEQRLVYLVLGMTMLQGIGKQLHPDINLVSAVIPYILEAGGRYLTHRERWYITLFNPEKTYDKLSFV